MPKITKFRPHLLKLFRENYWLLFSGYGVYTVPQVKPLLARLKTKLLEALRPEQSGFTPNGSIVDRIIALNTLLQTCREFNKPLWIACRLEVSLHLKSLWLLLSIPDKMVEVLKELSTETCSLCFGRWSTVWVVRSPHWCKAGLHCRNRPLWIWLTGSWTALSNNVRSVWVSVKKPLRIWTTVCRWSRPSCRNPWDSGGRTPGRGRTSRTPGKLVKNENSARREAEPEPKENVNLVNDFVFFGSLISHDGGTEAEILRRIGIAILFHPSWQEHLEFPHTHAIDTTVAGAPIQDYECERWTITQQDALMLSTPCAWGRSSVFHTPGTLLTIQ